MQLDQKALTQAKKAAATVYMDVDDNLAFDAAIEAGVDAYLSAIPAQSQEARAEAVAWGAFARAICESEGRDWTSLDNSRADCERWFAAGRACAALAAPAPEGWRPIDTAPKDGTRILLGCFSAPKHRKMEGTVAVAGWSEAGWGPFNPLWWPPTHWMPLPTPPTGKEGA